MSRVRRTGLTSIRGIAFTLCGIVTRSTPIIKTVYPNSPALYAALEAANVACSVLVDEADATLPIGD